MIQSEEGELPESAKDVQAFLEPRHRNSRYKLQYAKFLKIKSIKVISVDSIVQKGSTGSNIAMVTLKKGMKMI